MKRSATSASEPFAKRVRLAIERDVIVKEEDVIIKEENTYILPTSCVYEVYHEIKYSPNCSPSKECVVNEKSYKCELCDFSAKYKSKLVTHMITHTAEKPFKCSVCEYCAEHYGNLV